MFPDKRGVINKIQFAYPCYTLLLLPVGPGVHVSRLRRKIETDSDKPVLIKTVRNAGYIFTPAVEYG